jgi:hypothetical protein
MKTKQTLLQRKENTMNKRFLCIVVVLLGALLLSSCGSRARVGELRSESQSVELGGAKSVNVDINMGAGNLTVTGGAEKLLQADFTYNVAKLKPEMEYTNGTLVVQQPEADGLPILQGIKDFRNEWSLQLNSGVPMKLKVNMGAGNSDLQLAGLSLTRSDLILGAGKSTVDLNDKWTRDLDVTIDGGATDLSLRLPKDVGVRVNVGSGPHTIEAPDLKQEGNIYTNDAYGMSGVTLHIDLHSGIGLIHLQLVNDQ